MQKENKFIITCSAYLAAMGLLVFVQILASLGCFNFLSDQALEIIFSLIPQVLIMFLVPLGILVFCKKREQTPLPVRSVFNEINWGKISGKNILLAFALGLCLYILNIFVASFFAGILQSFGYQYSSSDNVFHGVGGLLLSLVLTAVLPGICEEFLHRGVLLNGLIKQFGVRKAVLYVSLLFGLMHMNVGQFFFATILGWFLCMAVLSSKSLWVGIIIHFTNNAISVYMSYAEELNLPGTDVLINILANPIIFVLTILVVIIVIGGILRRMGQESFEKNRDLYTVRYLAAQNQFNNEDFEQVKGALGKVIKNMPTWKAIFAYVETYDRPQSLKPLERALLVSTFMLGTLLTILTFVWGVW